MLTGPASMVACVLGAQTPILPTSATAHLASKAPTVRREWTAAACSPARMVRLMGQGQGQGKGGQMSGWVGLMMGQDGELSGALIKL